MQPNLRAKLACGLVELSASSFATGKRQTDGREDNQVMPLMYTVISDFIFICKCCFVTHTHSVLTTSFPDIYY